MPTYAYACTECDHRFEQHQAFSDAALTECPQCAGRLRKVFNSVGIVFKGSGFYRNDSRKEPVSASSDKGSDKAEKTDKGTDKGSGKVAEKSSAGKGSADKSSTTKDSGSSSGTSSSSGSGSASKTSAA